MASRLKKDSTHKKYMKENKFKNQWGIWYTYQLEQKQAQSKVDNKEYNSSIKKVFKIDNPSDFAYLWKNSPISLPSNYFGRQGGNQYTYVVEEKVRKINSIEFFKEGIQPRWEDPKNDNGGRLVFQVSRSDSSNQIYENIIFYLIGENFELSEKLNGFRFISSKSPSTVSYRAEIWFDFNNDDVETLSKFKLIFEEMFKAVCYEHSAKTVKFINMKGDDKADFYNKKDETKDSKDYKEKK